MCYSGIYIKENATIEDYQKIIDDKYNGVLGMIKHDKELKIRNEEIRKAEQEATRIYNESGETGGRSGTSGVSSSVNASEYISVMVSQAYLVSSSPNCPKNWIDMWREKFKDMPQVAGSFWRQQG
jgi:hypothetical protein